MCSDASVEQGAKASVDQFLNVILAQGVFCGHHCGQLNLLAVMDQELFLLQLPGRVVFSGGVPMD